jgi:hypothetical protein
MFADEWKSWNSVRWYFFQSADIPFHPPLRIYTLVSALQGMPIAKDAGCRGGLRSSVGTATELCYTCWTARGLNPGGGQIFLDGPDRPWGTPSLLYKGCGSFPGVKWPGCGADHPYPSKVGLRKGWGYTSASPLCLRRHFMGVTFTFIECTRSLNPIFVYIKALLYECCNVLEMEVELSSESSEQTDYFTRCGIPYDYHVSSTQRGSLKTHRNNVLNCSTPCRTMVIIWCKKPSRNGYRLHHMWVQGMLREEKEQQRGRKDLTHTQIYLFLQPLVCLDFGFESCRA